MYQALFVEAANEKLSRQLLRTLRAIPLDIVQAENHPSTPDAEHAALPLITLASRPEDIAARLPGGCRWIAILPPEGGEAEAFSAAGAFAVMRMPVERSVLISAISRSLFCIESRCADGNSESSPRGDP